MPLTTVTITGADDGVKHAELYALSEEFSFVEWGILHSSKRKGTPRYPSFDWMMELTQAPARQPPIRLAAHLCGDYTRAALAGDEDVLDTLLFQRHQINGFRPLLEFLAMAPRVPTEFILQASGETQLQAVAHEAAAICKAGGRASVLYDPSGGRGIEAFRWPAAPYGARLGYAGGIKPSNILDVLREIGPVDHDFWIDMESGVRTGDRFDLELVREVLERVRPFVAPTGEEPTT